MSLEQRKLQREYKKHQKITPQDILLLREWLKTQPHLPEKYITDLDLILAYHSCDFSSQVAKQVVDLNFTLRSKLPFLLDRTPNSVEMILQAWLMAPLPAYSTKGNQIILVHLLKSDPKYFVHMDIARYTHVSIIVNDFRDMMVRKYSFSCDSMLNGAWFTTRSFTMIMDLWQYEEGTKDGVCLIIDMDKFTWSHMTRTNLNIIQQFFYFSQEATFLKLKEIHVINTPNFTNKMYNICVQFINKKVLDVITFHPVDSDTIPQFMSTKDLPKEYGGEFKDVLTLRDEVWNKILSNEDYFKNEAKKKVDEAKRPPESKLPPDFKDVTGTFKQLEID